MSTTTPAAIHGTQPRPDLPPRTGAHAASRPIGLSDGTQGGREADRLLVIDDEPVNVKVLRRVLHRAGYDDVHGVTDPREALSTFEDVRPDLVLLDLHMPRVTGFEVLEGLDEAIADDDHVPVIVLTADVTDDARDRALALGATDYLTKPFDQTEVLLRIRNHLQTRTLHRHVRNRAQALAVDNEVQRLEIGRFQQLLEVVDAPVFVYAGDPLKVAYVNRAAAATTGLDARELVGREPDDGVGWGVAIRDPAASRVVRGEERTVRFETSLDHADGRPDVPVGVLVQAMPGNERTLFAVMQDFTPQKRAERALREAADREHEAADRLRTLNRSKDQFLTAISHELRTPLSIVMAGSQMLRDRFHDLSEERCSQLLERLGASADRLGRLMYDLLDLTFAQSGSLAMVRRPIDVAAAVRRALDATDLGDRQLDVDLPPVTALADEERLTRLTAKLLDNVARFVPEPAPVTVRLTDEGDRVRLVVEDAGPGIDPAHREDAFEPFWQGEAADSHSPGTGTGLTLVRAYARAHGGDAWIELPPGGGTAVHVTIPAS